MGGHGIMSGCKTLCFCVLSPGSVQVFYSFCKSLHFSHIFPDSCQSDKTISPVK